MNTYYEQTLQDEDTDQLILVNDQDDEIGSASKSICHDGDGLLHRAFSVLIFNHDQELLIQKRAERKRLWAGYWSNSCCSHPRHGETMENAVQRRVREELGMQVEVTYLYKFQYHAYFENRGAERELCSVYIGKSDSAPSVNSDEISDWRYAELNALIKEIAEFPDRFTPWFRQELKEILARHGATLSRLFPTTKNGI